MAFLICFDGVPTRSWGKHLRRAAPDLDLRVWPETGPVDEVVFVLTWRHPLGELRRYSNLRCIASMGADLLAAIDDGRLAGACLDVFRTEPLPPDHPFWDHPAVTVTPHTASLTNPAALAPRLVDNYRRVVAGEMPLHVVDRARGY